MAARAKVLPEAGPSSSAGGGGETGEVVGRVCNLWAIGSGAYGRLGVGSTQNQDGFVQVGYGKAGSDHRAIRVAAGAGHVICVILEEEAEDAEAMAQAEREGKGVVCTWGKCHYGQLGLGEEDQDRWVPTELPRSVFGREALRVRQVAAGDSFSLLLASDGALYSWGMGTYGSLGHDDNASCAVPRLVQALPPVREVAAGGFHVLARDDEGRLFGWGRNDWGQLGTCDFLNRRAPQLASRFLLRKVEKGKLDGQEIEEIEEIEEWEWAEWPAVRVVGIAAGFLHSVVLKEGGVAMRMGRAHAATVRKAEKEDPATCSSSNATGLGMDEHTVTQIKLPQSIKLQQAVAGKWLTLGLSSCGELWIDEGPLPLNHQQKEPPPSLPTDWRPLGSQAFLRLTSDPLDLPLPAFKSIACGECHCLAIDSSGRLFVWGSDRFRKLARTGLHLSRPALCLFPASDSQIPLFADAGSNQSYIITTPIPLS
ncbi:MAG: hypothetical protein Q8P67_06735 [archaeon]|nr:hypothetical protein [archaeon]